MSTEEHMMVLQALKDAIMEPQKRKVEDLINWAMEKYITEENLKTAIAEDLDIITLALNHFGLGHNQISPLLRTTFKLYWDEVENMLTDANNIYRIISRKPECAKLLRTEEGLNYVNRLSEAAYKEIYAFVWD